jgi:hypothetical protein
MRAEPIDVQSFGEAAYTLFLQAGLPRAHRHRSGRTDMNYVAIIFALWTGALIAAFTIILIAASHDRSQP